MRNKSALIQSIRALQKPPPAEPAFITDGRWYWADGRWLFPEQIERHRGPVVQFYLVDEPKPEQIPGATMIPVDSWLQGDAMARGTLGGHFIPWEAKLSAGGKEKPKKGSQVPLEGLSRNM